MSGNGLSGVIAAIATPVREDGAPDRERAVALARYLLANGCDGLNVLGTTGEATSFSLEERKEVMTAYRSNGLPMHRLMVGTGAAAVSDAVALTRHAAELGFAGALREILADAPRDRVLLETDAPYLPPTPHRGKRNEPAYLRLVAQQDAC